MEIYLPIAEMPVNIFLILLLGAGVGTLSGLFGVGGGFAMTPILIFIGVSPAVAVSTQANQLIAASVSGTFAHFYKKNIDFKLGFVMLIGSGSGSILGVYLFHHLQDMGQIDLVISLFYIVFLSIISLVMLIESMRTIYKIKYKANYKKGKKRHNILHGLPLKMKFPRSKLYISALLPMLVGFIAGILVAIMGIGGGFLLVPAMIYIIGVPVSVVAGTSLFQIIFSTSIVTFLQAATNHTVDAILALILLIGGVVGVQIGTRLGANMKSEHARAILAVLVLTVALGLAFDLSIRPDELYEIEMRGVE